MARIGRISVRGALKLAGWTLSGTLGCLAISLFYNWLSFRHMGGEALRQSLISATVLPIILAGPLFCYLTLKMRELAIANHRLHRLASTDALTACLNRGAFSAIARSPLRHLSQRRLCDPGTAERLLGALPRRRRAALHGQTSGTEPGGRGAHSRNGVRDGAGARAALSAAAQRVGTGCSPR